jgi:clan AA aspartic protease (TIGR02281 family)
MKYLLAAASLLTVQSTTAQAAAEITCGTPLVYVGQQSRDASDTVVGVDVYHSTDNREWQVRHRMANGSEIYRTNQYLMRDTTKGNLIQWQGASFKYPGLVMVGEIQRDQRNQLVYVESIYNNGALKMKSAAYCKQVQVAYSPPPPPPQYTPPPPSAPPPVAAPVPQPTIIVVPMPQPIQLPPVTVNPEPKPEPKAEPKPEPAPKPVAKRDVVPINVQNNSATLNVGLGNQTVTMLLDTGATTSTVTEAVADALVRGGHARWTGEERYKMANGSVTSAMTILIREVRIGTHVVRDVKASVSPNHAEMLLGLSVLSAIGSFTIDTRTGELSFVATEAAL